MTGVTNDDFDPSYCATEIYREKSDSFTVCKFVFSIFNVSLRKIILRLPTSIGQSKANQMWFYEHKFC